jgi:hypothetical protein
MVSNWSTPPASPWIYSGEHSAASLHRGGVVWIFQRWHDLARPGAWLVTLSTVNGVSHWPLCRNVHAVVDDFGTLIPVE